MSEHEWLTVDQFRERIGGCLSRTFLFEQAKQGTIPSVRIGRRVLIRADALDALYREQSQQRQAWAGDD